MNAQRVAAAMGALLLTPMEHIRFSRRHLFKKREDQTPGSTVDMGFYVCEELPISVEIEDLESFCVRGNVSSSKTTYWLYSLEAPGWFPKSESWPVSISSR
jgi:hypothetical protein